MIYTAWASLKTPKEFRRHESRPAIPGPNHPVNRLRDLRGRQLTTATTAEAGSSVTERGGTFPPGGRQTSAKKYIGGSPRPTRDARVPALRPPPPRTAGETRPAGEGRWYPSSTGFLGTLKNRKRGRLPTREQGVAGPPRGKHIVRAISHARRQGAPIVPHAALAVTHAERNVYNHQRLFAPDPQFSEALRARRRGEWTSTVLPESRITAVFHAGS